MGFAAGFRAYRIYRVEGWSAAAKGRLKVGGVITSKGPAVRDPFILLTFILPFEASNLIRPFWDLGF